MKGSTNLKNMVALLRYVGADCYCLYQFYQFCTITICSFGCSWIFHVSSIIYRYFLIITAGCLCICHISTVVNKIRVKISYPNCHELCSIHTVISIIVVAAEYIQICHIFTDCNIIVSYATSTLIDEGTRELFYVLIVYICNVGEIWKKGDILSFFTPRRRISVFTILDE